MTQHGQLVIDQRVGKRVDSGPVTEKDIRLASLPLLRSLCPHVLRRWHWEQEISIACITSRYRNCKKRLVL